MVTVKEAVAVLKDDDFIRLTWNGKVREMDFTDSFDLTVYGDLIVERVIVAIPTEDGKHGHEIVLDAIPYKRGERTA